MNCTEVNLIEEFKKNLQDAIDKTREEADKAMIEKCKSLAHENMKKRCSKALIE